MRVRTDLESRIRSLETRLLDPRVRSNPSELETLLADDFVEFGSSGRTFDRAEIVRLLRDDPRNDLSIRDFRLTPLADDCVLATYRTTAGGPSRSVRESLRSSIWVLRDGGWRLRFHQGTPSDASEPRLDDAEPAGAAWADLERDAVEIADAGRRLLPEVAFLATVSAAGRPRVHPFCPAIAEGRLWAFVLDGSPKRRDLDSNGRFAIHALPGPADEEFYVAGRAIRRPDPRLREVALRAMPYDDADDRHLLYELRLERALWTRWENFQKPGMRPVHRVWRPSGRR